MNNSTTHGLENTIAVSPKPNSWHCYLFTARKLKLSVLMRASSGEVPEKQPIEGLSVLDLSPVAASAKDMQLRSLYFVKQIK